MESLLNKCAECGNDFYGDHVSGCSKEENVEMCGICDKFYHNQGKAIHNQCNCDREA